MFQRLDKLRKNAFASVLLFGGNNDSSISGIWVFRGQELAFTVSIWEVNSFSLNELTTSPHSGIHCLFLDKMVWAVIHVFMKHLEEPTC